MRSSISSNSPVEAGYRQLSRSKIQSLIWAKRGSMANPNGPNALAGPREMARPCLASGFSPEARRQHADLVAVALIVLAEQADEIMLLVTDRDEHIDRHSSGEQQVPAGHFRRCPESQEEAQIERVTD